MICTEARHSLSAVLDGEQPLLPPVVVEHHLRVCHRCRAWSERVSGLHRLFRVRLIDAEPDRTDQIMAALPRTRRLRDDHVTLLRIVLLVIALVQLATALPMLFDDDSMAGHAMGGMDGHLERHIGIFALALSVGLFLVAWRPERARAMLPILGVLAAGLIWSCLGDIWAGRPVPGSLLGHGADIAGFATVWLLVRTDGDIHQFRRQRAVAR